MSRPGPAPEEVWIFSCAWTPRWLSRNCRWRHSGGWSRGWRCGTTWRLLPACRRRLWGHQGEGLLAGLNDFLGPPLRGAGLLTAAAELGDATSFQLATGTDGLDQHDETTPGAGRLISNPFDHRVTAAGRVLVSRRGRHVAVIAGGAADRLVAPLSEADAEGQQQLLARATGNYRRGNERGAG